MSELKSSGEAGETIEKVEKTVKGITSQATKLSTEYDLPAKAKQALGVAGELADTAIVKVNIPNRRHVEILFLLQRVRGGSVSHMVLWRLTGLSLLH